MNYPGSEKKILIEAFFLTGFVRLAICLLSFKKLVAFIENQIDDKPVHLDKENMRKIHEIGQMVELVSRHTLWKSQCLVQALAAQFMLKRRGIMSTLYLGVAKDDEKKLIAHAWLKCGDIVITGDKERERFTAVAQYTSNLGRRIS